MSELIFLVEEDPEGGYTARALGHSIFTKADTLVELRANIRDVVQCHFDDGISILVQMDVRQAILKGLADSEAGRTASTGEVKAHFNLPQ